MTLPFGVWLLGSLLVLGMLLCFVALMPEAFHFHFIRGLVFREVFGVTGCWLVIVEVVLHAKTINLASAQHLTT